MRKLVLFTMTAAFSALSIAGTGSFNPLPNSPQGKAQAEALAKKQAQTSLPVLAPVTPAPKPVAPPPANAQKPATPTNVQGSKAPN